MPAKVKVRILAGRNLPVMDKSSDASDAFVEVKLGNTTYKTEVYRRSLNPFWNSEWFRFEVSDQELQDEPLQIRIMDYDTYSANDAIGKVYINLNPLLVNPGRSMSGWLPIYDTLHGVRGEINCMVKVNLFADNNRYRHSSCGVRFFFSDIPNGYKCEAILGFVDELLVNDDPEYQWIDKIRTPRASNEARQTLFTKLSGEVQRKLGLKAEIFGGNAVIGYQQSFDLEGGSGIVGRGIGTAVVLSKIGFPYEGIISPLHMNNQHAPYPYCANNRLAVSNNNNNQSIHDRSSRKSLNLYRSTNLDRPLVHSVSAERPHNHYHQNQPTGSSQQQQPISQTQAASLDVASNRDMGDEQRVILLAGNKPSSSFESNSTSPTLLQQQKSTSSSRSTNSSQLSPVANTTGSQAAKRRRDKSQSASVDDALSIIEERFDDDGGGPDHLHNQLSVASGQQQQPARARLLSGSSGKGARQMVREREIDIHDDSIEVKDFSTQAKGTTTSTSSADDDDTEENILSSATTISNSTQDTSKSFARSESLLSSSSPSASLLTDETIKARVLPTSETNNRYSSPLRRSDTDLSQAQSLDSRLTNDEDPRTSSRHGGDSQMEGGGSSFSRSESTYSHTNQQTQAAKRSSPDSRPSSSLQKLHCSGSGGNSQFVQSVRTIKAQQHLLQNMIKHQNQNLLTSSNNRAKNAFMYPNRVHQSEYPFVTLKRYPDNMIQCTGGVVSVHSVKLLDHIINDEESETRDIWWTEIRKEIRSHAKALNCNTILGYSETSKVLGDVCVLSACGTAAILNPMDSPNSTGSPSAGFKQQPDGNDDGSRVGSPNNQLQTLKVPRLGNSPPPTHSSMPSTSSQCDQIEQQPDLTQTNKQPQPRQSTSSIVHQYHHDNSDTTTNPIDCSFCHTPLICVESITSLASCTICQASKVPDVLLLTIEPPQNLNIVSAGTLVQARVCRAKRDSHGEASAKEIGDALPFLEYELHRQLFVGENMLTGVATGTGCFVLGLPTPEAPQISAGKGIKASKLNEIQRLIALSAIKNRENLGLNHINAQLALYHDQMNSSGASGSGGGGGTQSSPEPQQQQQQQQQLAAQLLAATKEGATRKATSHSPNPPPAPPTTSQDDNNTSGDSAGVGRSSSVTLKTTSDASNYLRDHYNNLQSHNHHHHHHHKHRRHHHKSSKNFVAPSSDNRNMLAPAENLTHLLSDDNNIVLEVDDNEDADIIALLIDSDTPDGYLISNSESIPTINQSSITSINMFTQVMRAKLTGMDQFAQQFDWIIQALFVKLRRSLPCCLTNISFVVDLPESHIVQISVTGCLLGLSSAPGKPSTQSGTGSSALINSDDASSRPTAESTSNIGGGLLHQSASATTDSSMSPSTSSTSSSSSSSSPSSSSAGLPHSSSSISSMKSAKDVPTIAPAAATKSEPSVSEPKSLRKQLSKSNLAALLVSGKSVLAGGDKKKTSKIDNNDDIEMSQRPAKGGSGGPDEETSTRDTIAAVKLEIEQNRLGSSNNPRPQPVSAVPTIRPMRAVFKKQQTYPGASSPSISGHDKLLPLNSNEQLIIGGSTSGAGNAARRATIILNKVKQPLKDLGSNFNTTSTNNSPANHHHHPSEASGSPLSRQNGGSSGRNKESLSGGGKASRSQISGPSSSSVSANLTSAAATAASTSSAATAHQTSIKDPMGHHIVCPTGQVPGFLGSKSSADRAMNSSIDITSLSYIPGAKKYHYLGNLSLSFVRETNSVRENGGLNGFIHCFLMEVYAIIRAHVSALGGNAFLSFRLQQSCIFYHSNKNQAQCLISVAGDAVQVTL